MSLINQVLKDVEARQGGTTTDGWAGQQVKPVLSHQPSASNQWIRRLIWALVILGLAAWVYLQWDGLLSFYRSTVSSVTGQKPSASLQSKSPVVPLPTVPVAATPKQPEMPAPVVIDAQPKLTRSLFSEWQAALSESVTKPAIRQKVAPARAESKPEQSKGDTAPQVEGEFSIKPAENNPASTVVSVIEPPLASGSAGKSKTGTDTRIAESNSADPRGTVNKQVRPEQEVNLLIQKAVDHEQKGRLSEALTTLRQALVTHPQSEDARQLLAAYLFESKQDAEAVALLQAGIKRYPEQVGLYKSLAKWQLAHNQPEAMLQNLNPVANTLARDAEAQWMMAIAHQQLGQHQVALPYFERAIVLHPGQAQWVVAYAISLQASGQSAQALQQFQSVQGLPLSERLAEFVNQRIRQLGGVVQSRDE